MNAKQLFLWALGVLLLAGCSSGGALDSSVPRSTTATSSWMSRVPARQALLYVSSPETHTVNVYQNYLSKSVQLVGQLSAFTYPYGECSDSSGNVYITDSYAVDVVEYAHGGTAPVKTLPVTGFPIGCSIDSLTGNLAVSVYTGSQGANTRGGVFVFAKGSGTPTLYADPNLWQMWPPAYNDRGNLFVLGYNPTVELAELPAGGKAFRQISLGTAIQAPGSVLWNGKYLYAVDQQYKGGSTTAVYRLAISGTRASVLQTTILNDTCGSGADVVQPLIAGTTIFGPNHNCTNRLDFWNYPAGGKPVRAMSPSIAPLGGAGQTISQ